MKKRNGIFYFMSGVLAGGVMLTATTAYAVGGSMIEVFYNVKGIYINNVLKSPDKRPFIYEGTTYVPLRYVSESLGHNVDWDGATNTIYIGGSKVAGDGSSVNAGNPVILSAAPSKTAITPGESITVSVTANTNTEGVKLLDESFNVLGSSSEYTEIGGGRIFTVNYTPSSSFDGSRKILVCGVDTTGTAKVSDYKEFTLTVQGNKKINSIKSGKSSAALNASVQISVYTNEDVTKVKLVNDYNSDVKESGDYTTSNGERCFLFNVSSSKAASIRYTAYAGSSSGYDDSVSKSVSVNYSGSSSSSSTTSSNMTLTVSAYSSSYRQVTVTTYNDVESLEILDNNENVIESTKKYTSSGSNKRIWTLKISHSDLSSKEKLFYAYAYAYDDYSDQIAYKNFYMGTGTDTGNDEDSDLIYDLNYTSSSSSKPIYDGDTVDVSFYTEESFSKVWINDPSGNTVEYEQEPYYSSSKKRWTASFYPDRSGTYSIIVKYGGSNVTVATFFVYYS